MAVKLDWCEYMEKIGKKVKECEMSSEPSIEEDKEEEKVPVIVSKGRPIPQKSSEEENEPDSYETFSSYETCHGYYGRCKPSDECESGVLCTHKVTKLQCCTAPKNQCPSVDQMGYQCKKKNPVNWCNTNEDCGTNLVRSQICCPTGCGYNTCLNNVQNMAPSTKFRELHETAQRMSPDCPNPFLIPVNCLVPRPVSWCTSVRECPTYHSQRPRRCCLTPCGYNICLTRMEEKWLIA
ncbi:hypothetical protein DdX_09805 [Ditylenchus destructor]|uniref:WAP domain-containing protein n=1 Tax=Ditylenchus destructor TaxID=166010 RepID=A0AAD4N5K8_9BILA|nr:hypothetical protein DdX_09805 [Ditylenchus destructor]